MQRLAVPIMVALSIVLFSFTPGGKPAPAGAQGMALPIAQATPQPDQQMSAVSSGSFDSFNEQILHYVNQFRADNGKSPLTMNKDMVETAAIHSSAMAKGTVAFGHDNFDLRFKYVAAKLGGINAFAENVAMGQMGAQQVVDGWAHSPGHRKNMLGDYNLTGIATATADNGTIYFTQIFAHKQ